MGVYPESFMAPMRKDVGTLLARVEPAAPQGDARLAMGAPRPAAPAHGAEAAHAPAAEGEGH
jgi:NADH-quinone oxidoreductase subunit M